eukprot:1475936-Rhodomonas_salina.1
MNSATPRALPRLGSLVGTLTAPIEYGIAVFTDLAITEAATQSLRLNISGWGLWIESEPFSVTAGPPASAVFLSPQFGVRRKAGDRLT